MQSLQEKEKFVKTLISNVGYFNKELVKAQATQFLRKHTAFSAREAVRKANGDNYFSFLELGGFLQVGKCLAQMCIGIPTNYPASPPVFMLATNRQIFLIHEEQRLLQSNMISFEKNEVGEEFMRLRFPMVESQWNPKANTSLSVTFDALTNVINRPPILVEKNEQAKNTLMERKSQRPSPEKTRIKSKEINEMLSQLHEDTTEIIFSKQSLSEASLSLDYHISRQKFMAGHLEDLTRCLKKKQSQIASVRAGLEDKKLTVEQNYNCDSLIDMGQEEETKLALMSQQQALKEAEITLRAKIEKDPSAKFGDYKKVMKVLYDRMFDNQSQVLLQNR